MAKRTARWRSVSMVAVTTVVTAALTVGPAIEVVRPVAAAGAISLTTLGTPYAQDFDTLASTGTSSVVPDGWAFVETGTNANTIYSAGTGSSTAGDTYSFGAAGSTERAFGGLRSGSLVPVVGAQFTNATGAQLTRLDISFTGEQWRAGVLNRNAADRLDFQWSSDATSLTTGVWNDADALDVSSPNISTTAGALNGNLAANRAAVTGSVNVTIPAGASFWIRWNDVDITSSDDGLSIDDFTLTPMVVADAAPAVAGTVPADGATNVPANQTLSVTFTEPVNLAAGWFSLVCTTSGAHTATVSGGPVTYTVDPDTSFAFGESCTLTVNAVQVSDADGNDPPDTMTVDFTAGFATEANPCALPFTPAPAIQGSGASAAITGAVTTEGVVVGDYEYPGSGPTSASLRGFYLQDAAGDGDPTTSDAIFVFNGNANSVALGDNVRVTGTAGEFQGQTQITASGVQPCGTGSVTPTAVSFPVPSADFLERYEGMLVTVPQTMYVTEHFQLGRFGQVVLAADGRLAQPTNVVAPGSAANALQASNNLAKIILDDASQAQNPDPILFARNGGPLTATNTLRGGDTATGIQGVMTYTWAGNAASPNAYRIRPVDALGGSADFQAVNQRPVAAPAVGGTTRVVGMNLLNFFNTFADSNTATPGCFPSGNDSDCRGANSATEFARQYVKTVAAILAMDPDVLGVNELENDGYGPASALQFLVDQLNAATAPGTYAFIDVDANTGQTNAMGTDAIRVAQIYKPAVVTPVGATAVLNSVAFVNGGDGSPRARPSLAQGYAVNATGAVFVVDLNHLKSKGSACDAPDAGDGQGNCNQVRVNSAIALTQWLGTDPTGTGDPDVLLIGDYNSYAKEDPIAVIEGAGFTNLIDSFIGPDAYSYVFDGQWGYLDHALGSPSLVGQVSGVGDYHINADEPAVLDYNVEFKSPGQVASLYAPDQFRVSDHDSVVIGLTPNAAPTVTTAGGIVAEGGTVQLTATGQDPNGDALAYAWDLDGDGVFETPGPTVTFSAALLDGPTTAPVAVQVTDPGGLAGTATATVTVTNVALSVTAVFASSVVACGAENASLRVTFTDPAPADTHAAQVVWGDGATETIDPAVSPVLLTHTYADAGSYDVAVTVTDDDGGAGTASASVAVAYITSGLLAPIRADGTAIFRSRASIPVKVRFTDCDGSIPTDLAPQISVTVLTGPLAGTVIDHPASTSAAGSPGVMRFSIDQYVYELAASALPDPAATYRVTVSVPATGQVVTGQFTLRP